MDSLALRKLKGTIRKRESLAATRYIGIPNDQVHFLNLPFMKQNQKKNPPFTTRNITNQRPIGETPPNDRNPPHMFKHII